MSVTTDSLSSSTVASLWQAVALNPEEDSVVNALRILEPDIERVAYVADEGRRSYPLGSREGMVVKLQSLEQRVPIGTMGDGMWRMLALALALVQSKGGVLLVDEVDTGLHHTVMADMWKMVLETAKRLDVQLFATTHSYDCVYSLAAFSREKMGTGEDVAIHRLEAGKDSSVVFTEKELALAAERGIEIR